MAKDKLSLRKDLALKLKSQQVLWEDSEEEEYKLNPEPNILLEDNINIFYDFKKVDKPYMQPLSYQIPIDDKYHTACYLTSNLTCEHFLKNVKNKVFKMEYYDSPFHEFHVQGLFFQNIEKIEFIDVDLNLDFFIHLVEQKKSFEFVSSIVLRRCNIDKDMLAILCPDLEYAYSLTLLDLSENPIGDGGFKYILAHLYDWTSLRSLILIDTELSTRSFESLGSLYGGHSLFLTEINLSRNVLNKANSVKRLFSKMNKQKPPLEEIILRNCGLEGSDVSSYFYNYLKNMKNLNLLDLSFNLFNSEEDALSLVALLMESDLATLCLSFNLFNEKCIISLLNGMFAYPSNSSIKTLVIENFSIPQNYLITNPEFLSRTDIVVKHAGIRNLAVIELEDFNKKLLQRFHFLYKKDKPKKDMVVETLQEFLPKKRMSRVKNDDFKDALLQIPSDHIEPSLVQEIVKEFSGGGSRSNAALFIKLYLELFPPKVTNKNLPPIPKENGKSSLDSPKDTSLLKPNESDKISETSEVTSNVTEKDKPTSLLKPNEPDKISETSSEVTSNVTEKDNPQPVKPNEPDKIFETSSEVTSNVAEKDNPQPV